MPVGAGLLAISVMALVLTSCGLGPVGFSADQTSGPDPLIVRFANSTTGAVAWHWDFGDGATSKVEDPIHTYLAPGTYSVTLTATGADQAAASVIKSGFITTTLTVNPPLQGNFGEFVAYCPFSHRAANDPIVFPGQPGASHSHDFFGNTSTDADSTFASLRGAPTTCDPVADQASYWAPTMSADGVPVEVEQATFYYSNESPEPGALRAPPVGLEVLTGRPGCQGPTATPATTSGAAWATPVRPAPGTSPTADPAERSS